MRQTTKCLWDASNRAFFLQQSGDDRKRFVEQYQIHLGRPDDLENGDDTRETRTLATPPKRSRMVRPLTQPQIPCAYAPLNWTPSKTKVGAKVDE